MKTHLLALAIIGPEYLQAQLPNHPVTDVQQQNRILERGPHYAVWETESVGWNREGELATHRSKYVELAGEKHYCEDGEWKETPELIEAVPGGAAALKGNTAYPYDKNGTAANNLSSAQAFEESNREIRGICGRRGECRLFRVFGVFRGSEPLKPLKRVQPRNTRNTRKERSVVCFACLAYSAVQPLFGGT